MFAFPAPLLGDMLLPFGQTFAYGDLAVIALLVLLEGVLSIDNALVLGLLAKRLPKSQRARALTYGLIGAFVFRIAAIGTASFLLKWTIVKLIGGGYLVFIAVKHLFFESHEDDTHLTVDAEQQPVLVNQMTHGDLTDDQREREIAVRAPLDVGPEAPAVPAKSAAAPPFFKSSLWIFIKTIIVIEITDVAFAVDSILAAIALVGGPPPGTPDGAVHPKLWVVIAGGIIGVILMRYAATIFISLLEKFPRFEVAAYLLVIVIGMKLLLDWAFNSDWTSWGLTFHHDWAVAYLGWLKENWIFQLPADAFAHPHLLDFHDLRRPECITFWLLMLVCFLVGFIPSKKHGPKPAALH